MKMKKLHSNFVSAMRRLVGASTESPISSYTTTNAYTNELGNNAEVMCAPSIATSSMISSITSSVKPNETLKYLTANQPSSCRCAHTRKPRRFLFYFTRQQRNKRYICNVCGNESYVFLSPTTPISSRSVSFTDSDSWPFIDDEASEDCVDRDSGYNEDI